MTDAWRRILAFLATLPLATSSIALASSGDARGPAKTAWAETVRQGSLEAYAEFAMTYPDSQYAALAYEKLANAEIASPAARAAAGLLGTEADTINDPWFASNSMIVV